MAPPNNRETRRKSKAFDLLALAAAFAKEKNISLTDPLFVDRFVSDAAVRLSEALDDAPLMHGSRTEKLFEATVLSLGRYRLFKTEDVGRVHASKSYRAPDFRIVLNDGVQWLVEVKNVRRENPRNQRTTMSAAYLASLQTYADAVGTPLRLAIFWSRWNIWTIIAPEKFRRANGDLRVAMMDAIVANEFVRLGDMTIMTTPPLRLLIEADTAKPSKIGQDGLAEFVIGSARMFSGDIELKNLRDRRLAEILFLFGEWPCDGPTAIMDENGITGVEFVASPEEPSDQGFDGIGWASRIFSRYFSTQTVDGDKIIQLNGQPVPTWFAPLAKWDFEHSKLPLWLGHIEPSDPPP
ncbi:hypothetical protein [Parasphingorhabdus sp.]|uniref:hypothetical protein n=1 Tax=Parasphingorhabdus sp. TaxID=2709688 RepID=UPI003D2993CE